MKRNEYKHRSLAMYVIWSGHCHLGGFSFLAFFFGFVVQNFGKYWRFNRDCFQLSRGLGIDR